MRIGKRLSARCRTRGLTYWMLLFVLASLGAGLAAFGESALRRQQRAQEAELAFRGAQIVDALQRYAAFTPAGASPRPAQLADLVEDRRHDPPLHHLRRLYTDPFTGQADWVLLRRADGGIVGVHSRSTRPALGATDAAPATVGDRRFQIEPAIPPADDDPTRRES